MDAQVSREAMNGRSDKAGIQVFQSRHSGGSRNPTPCSSFRAKRSVDPESRFYFIYWIPASAGMTNEDCSSFPRSLSPNDLVGERESRFFYLVIPAEAGIHLFSPSPLRERVGVRVEITKTEKLPLILTFSPQGEKVLY